MSIFAVFFIFLISIAVFVVTLAKSQEKMPIPKGSANFDELPEPEDTVLNVWFSISILICAVSFCLMLAFAICSHETVVSNESTESSQYELLRVDSIKETEGGDLFYVSFTKDSDTDASGAESCYVLCTGKEQANFTFAYLDSQGKFTLMGPSTSDCTLKYSSEAEVASVTVYRNERTSRHEWWIFYDLEITKTTTKYEIYVPISSNVGSLRGDVATIME